MKGAFKMKKKVFFIICKRLSLKQMKQLFLEGESPTLSIFKSQYQAENRKNHEHTEAALEKPEKL